MKTRRFDFNFRPLKLSHGLAVLSGVPERQSYDGDTGTYAPDYRLVPLTVQPRVGIMDPDGVLADGSVNAQLANVCWYEIIGGTSRLIPDSDTDYTITRTGANTGRIQLRKNASPSQPITLEFHAEYVDTRTSQIFRIQDSLLVRCDNSTSETIVTLDAADQSLYDPLRDVSKVTVRATLWHDGQIVPTANRKFGWRVLTHPERTSVALGSPMAYFVEQGADSDSSTVTVDRSLMGDGCTLVCYGAVITSAHPAVVLTDPRAQASFVRRLPRYDYDIQAVPTDIPTGTSEIHPKAMIQDAKGLLPDAESELLATWYIATNKSSGSLQYKQVAVGRDATVSTEAFSPTLGAVLALDVTDRGPWKACSTATDEVLTDNEGNVLLIR